MRAVAGTADDDSKPNFLLLLLWASQVRRKKKEAFIFLEVFVWKLLNSLITGKLDPGIVLVPCIFIGKARAVGTSATGGTAVRHAGTR